MTITNFLHYIVLTVITVSFLFTVSLVAAADDLADSQKIFAAVKQKYDGGLPKDAYDLARTWLLDAKNSAVADKKITSEFLQIAVTSLVRLNRTAEIDELLETVVTTHKNNWQVLTAVAIKYSSINHFGFIIDNKFQRGNNGKGEWTSAYERDRVRSLQLCLEAMTLITKAEKPDANFFIDFANLINNQSAWQLQSLTDLTTLPDYDKANRNFNRDSQNKAPVDVDGNPIYFNVPESFELASNDGERRRWLLEQAMKHDPSLAPEVLRIRAVFCQSQFGVQTLQRWFDFYRKRDDSNETQKTANILSLDTLNENETIADIATGIKRFTLPDDQNHIKLFRRIYDTTQGDVRWNAGEALASIYENRRQYTKAAEFLQSLIKESPNEDRKKVWQSRLDQIVKNWGSFAPAGSNVTATVAELRYVFRNGKKVTLTANEIKVEKLINDIKEYIKSKPNQINWNKIQIDAIGNRLIYGDRNLDPNSKQDEKQVRKKYLGEEVAKWSVELTPAEKHFNADTVINFTNKSGAYLISAAMEDGNTEYAIVWLNDTVIVKKQIDNAILYFVADAVAGEPIPNANIEFFGYKTEYKNEPVANGRTRQSPTPTWTFDNFTKQTNTDGFAFVEKNEQWNRNYWLITATSDNDSKKRFVNLGRFNSIWFNDRSDSEYNEVKAFVITDRPVYRPKDKVQIKAWVGTAKYDLPNVTEWANKTVNYEVYSPRGEKFITKNNVKLDNYGGVVDEFELPKDAMLGSYHVFIKDEIDGRMNGGASFRVEEYKKPEYEVTVDAPKEPVKLGDTITATIHANYYFGSPVAEATVKYKVLRQTADEAWYPLREWDWFYGNGYGWFAYNSTWLEGWERWGCRCVPPFWFPRRQSPPEVVAETETKIKPDGTLDVVIDTSFAKEIFPNDNQRYTITAEVVDNSRQTIVGTGNVLVTKEPFKVYAWTNYGHYVPEQKIAAGFQTRRLDGKPVSGDADVKVFKIVYIKNDESANVTAQENEVYNAKVKFDDTGRAALNLNAGDAGQYRISCTINGQEGGYVFNVYPKSETAANKQSDDKKSLWRYNTLELIPDKAEYAPNENVALRINTERSNSFVMLFVKPVNGVAFKPQLLRLDGNSQEVKIPVELRDMPNFFIEAVTVSGGDVVTEVKEIVVPPQQKVLNVEVKPSSETYKPGGKAKAELTVTDIDGKPIVGQVTVSIYDKSVEYISGGSNVNDIKEFFWKWRRTHYPNTETSLLKYIQKFSEPEKPSMMMLGAFGNYPSRNSFPSSGGYGDAISLNKSRSLSMDAVSTRAFNTPALPSEVGLSVMNSGVQESESVMTASEDIPAGSPLVEPTIRKNFADTAYWNGAINTNANGIAQIELDMPESLTTWKINVWSMATGTRVGYGNAEVVTRKDLLIRMQTPRFLVEKDTSVFSANVHNYLAADKDVNVSLELDGKMLVANDSKSVAVKIPASGEKRVDWTVEAKTAGEAVVRMKALTDEESDAMEKTLPVYVHGILKQESFSNYAAPEKDSATITFNVPAERKPEQTKLTVRFSPTLAASMVDALPYLTDYVYGCTEQTLNRFLPTVITQKILLDMNVDLNKLKDLKTNLNAQELGENRKSALARQFEKSEKNPVYDVEQVRDMVSNGVAKLANMQCSDGGWGWFSGYGEYSYPHTTAVVIHGLQLAKQNDAAVDNGVISRGVEWLRLYQSKQVKLLKNGELPEEERKNKDYKTAADANDAFIFMILADNDYIDDAMKDFLWRDRGKLSLYAVAMFGIALEKMKNETVKVAECIKIIEQYLVQDDENQTAYLDLRRYNGWCWWAWYGSEYETQAYYLKLLVRTNPKNSVAPRLVKYLLNNRRHATHWNSTRDTAICIEAFAEFLKATGETSPNVTVDVVYDGAVKKSVAITPENLFTIDNTFVLEGDEVSSGAHKVELRKKGNAPLYANVYVENFTLEDPITKAGLEVKIERRIYKLVRDESATTQVTGGRGQVVEQKVEKYKREEFPSQQSEFKSGDLVEIELIVESKNDYESLLIEDLKAAGLEPVENRSGYNGNSMNAYVEYRDERTSFFVYQLPRGKHSLTYRLRAEQPGNFSALPAKIEAMYAPELKGNSDENRVKVND
ncbi:MAG: alpha-2-macroglobulin [Planctomycetaceae bacterium]|jgi:uncharacterized protein YfaS (alpha-2-macroglobulin family)|nr:alpha-2-macroglobulin [Planctomycetaceae bacterium]